MIKIVLLMVTFVAFSNAGATQGNLRYVAPEGWTVRSPSSSMRTAEFVLPKAAGDAEDSELIVFYFGGGGGSVEANLQRWISQMEQPDGRPSRSVAKVDEFTTNSLKVTVLDIPGTLVAPVMPGQPKSQNKRNFRLIAAVIETPAGPYFVRVTGPERTVENWKSSIDNFFRSVSFR